MHFSVPRTDSRPAGLLARVRRRQNRDISPVWPRPTTRAKPWSARKLENFLSVSARRQSKRGATPPSSDSRTRKPGRVTGSSGGARRGQGRPLGWKLKAPDPEEPAAWRSYPPPRGQTLPGSVGSRWFQSSPMEGAPSVRGGASKPAHAGASGAPPMLSPQVQGLPGRSQLPLGEATPDTPTAAYRGCRETPSADCTAVRRGRGPPED